MNKTAMKNLISATALTASLNVAANESPVELMSEFYQIADARPVDSKKLASYFSESFVDHDAQHSDPKQSDAEHVVGFFAALGQGAPNSVHNIEFIHPVGDNKALVRWRYVGKHTDELLGMPATNNSFDIAGMELWEFKNGKITGLWHVEELLTFMEQLSPSK